MFVMACAIVILSEAKDLILVNLCNEQDEILRPEQARKRIACVAWASE
jgi:hypothetical protein